MSFRLFRLSFLGALATVILNLAAVGYADDWPQFLGPERAGVTSGAGLLSAWPEDGLRVLWRRHLGAGFSGIVAVDDRLFTLFAEGEKEYVACYRAADGTEEWRVEVGEKFIDVWGNGPRSTPVLDGEVLYAVASRGGVYALRAADGGVVWTVDMESRFGPSNRPFLDSSDVPSGEVDLGPYWGHCSSPLVVGDLLIVHPAADGGRSLAALDKRTGETRWSLLDNPISYSSPLVVTIDGQRQVVMAMAYDIVGVSLDGELLWRVPWALFTIAQPVFFPPNRIFISAPNEVGGLLFAVHRAAGGWGVEEIWRYPTMRNNWGSSVAAGNGILGFDNATLKLIGEDGELLWAKRGIGKGTVVLADDLLIALSDRGNLVLAEWSREGFRQLGRTKVLEGPSWTVPTVADGRLYLRDHQEMIAIDLAAATYRASAEGESGASIVREDGASVETREETAIARVAEALGGEAAWGAIDSTVTTGKHTSFSFTQASRLSRKRPDFYRFDHGEAMFPLTTAWDGEEAWWLTSIPMISKANWPVAPPSLYLPAFELEAEFEPPFLYHREKGHQITYLGQTEFEGERYLGFEIVRGQTGESESWFVDPATWLPVLRVSQSAYHGYISDLRVQFLDYRRVAGVMLPYRVETEIGNDFTIFLVDDVQVNVPLDDALFRRPLPKGMEELRPLAGTFQVTIENRDDPSFNPEAESTQEWEVDTTSAVIESHFDGSLLEEEIDVNTARPRKVRRTFTYDRFHDVFRVSTFDSFSNQLDILEGTFDDAGRLVVSNLGTGTSYSVYQETFHTREILYDVTEKSFRLDREVSTNGGETWRTEYRFHYVRAADQR